MEKKALTARELKAIEQVKRANAYLAKVRREQKQQLRKEQNHHKYMMGGVVAKYFPECYDFEELEMNRIIACAFSLKDVKNMINIVLKERQTSGADANDLEDRLYEDKRKDNHASDLYENEESEVDDL